MIVGSEAVMWAGTRLGLLGGTFDPPHRGHLVMARTATDVLGLDRVLFSPAPAPPHKAPSEISPYADRMAMARCAVEGTPRMAVTSIEASHHPSYSVELLRACRARTQADLYFIMGADSLAELASWHEPGEILRSCTLVVFAREGIPLELGVPGEASVVVFDSPVVDVSSSRLREAAARGEDISADVPGGVMEYIREHDLYGRTGRRA